MTKVYAIKRLDPRRDTESYQHIATAELHSIGNQAPYFAITVNTWNPTNNTYRVINAVGGGCQHDVVEALFPEWAKYIKWHLTSLLGPTHYVANTLYHASNRDYNGLFKDEKRQLVNGRTKLPVWEIVIRNEQGEVVAPGSFNWQEMEDPNALPKLTAAYEPVWIGGKGKDRDFSAARHSAVWPEATDEQLSLPREELQKLLEARLPMLMEEFQADMLELFGKDTWSIWHERKEGKPDA